MYENHDHKNCTSTNANTKSRGRPKVNTLLRLGDHEVVTRFGRGGNTNTYSGINHNKQIEGLTKDRAIETMGARDDENDHDI